MAEQPSETDAPPESTTGQFLTLTPIKDKRIKRSLQELADKLRKEWGLPPREEDNK